MGSLPGGVARFDYDGDRLVASEATGQRVFEWNGESWIGTGASGSVGLWDGEIVTYSDVQKFWLPPRPDPDCWSLGNVRVVENRVFAFSSCFRPYPALEYSAALQEYVGSRWETLHVQPGEPLGQGIIRFVEGCSESVYFSAGSTGPFPSGNVFRIGDDGNEPIPVSVAVSDMTCLGTDFYLVDLERRVFRSSGGLDTQIGVVPLPSSVEAIETYEGEVYIAGLFSDIDGFETRNFASWKP